MDLRSAQVLAHELAETATSADAARWALCRGRVERLDGRDWLLLDDVARRFSHLRGTPVSGVHGWLGAGMAEPTGLVAAVTSMHVDGRIRERAVRALGGRSATFVAPALAVRLLDHVAEVRDGAWTALRPLLSRATAEPVLDVLLAGQDRQRGPGALHAVETALAATAPMSEWVRQLRDSEMLRVRRRAFTLGQRDRLWDSTVLIDGACKDTDQWIRAKCAEWLMATDEPEALTPLLGAHSVEARLAAITKLPDRALSDAALGGLLLDRAPRVREQARWRANRRGFDAQAFYRATLGCSDIPPRAVAACLDALAIIGDDSDVAAAAAGLQHESARVRAAAVNAVSGRVGSPTSVELLVPVLLDPSARVSSAAANALGRHGVEPGMAEAAWKSVHEASRRAAWRLARRAGGWARVAADARAAVDRDPRLRSLGRAGLENWLAVSAATTWGRPTEEQRRHIATALPLSGLSPSQQRLVAFHAGIESQTATTAGDAPKERSKARGRWLRLLRGPRALQR